MANKNQKNEHTQEKQQPAVTPTVQVELTDEELGQVVGGSITQKGHGGMPQPDPTAVE